MRKSLIPAAVIAAILTAGPASADVTFSIGNVQYYNVNIAADTDAAAVVGDIGNTGAQMTFNTMLGPWATQTPTDMHCQHGVAFCESLHDSTTLPHTGFSSITLTALGGTSWTAGDFALDLLGSVNGTVTFEAFNGATPLGGANPATFAIDATGQNQYNFVTSAGETVTSILIISTSPLNLVDIKQVSLMPLGAAPIPEPATLALLGTGLLGLGFVRRRKTQ